MNKNSLFFSSGDITSQQQFSIDNSTESKGDTVEWTIFREGRFQHPYYGKLDFNTDFLERMVSNHKRNVLQRKVGFDISHNPTNGATSWIEDSETGLFLQEETIQTNSGAKTRTFLKARHQLTPLGKQLIEDKIYRYFSSEVDPNYSSGEIETLKTDNGDVESVLEFGPTLIGGGIVMRPYIPNLGPVAFKDDTPLEEKANQEVTVFRSPDEGDAGIFMFKDTVDTVIKNNQTKKFFQFSAPQPLEEENEVVLEQEYDEKKKDSTVELGNDADIGDETPHSNEQDQGDKMKFADALTHVRGLDSDKAKVSYLEEIQNQFADTEDAEIFSDFLDTKKEIAQARAEAEDALHRKIQFQNQVNSLEGEKVKMANDLREAREGSRQAQVKQFSAELRESGHTEAVIKEVETLLTGLPSESYSQSFSVKSGEEDGDLNLTFKDMITRIFSKLPKGATPLEPVESLDANQAFAADDQDGAKTGETVVDPDVGTDTFSEDAEEDADVPENIMAFSKLNGYFPAEVQWDWIDDKGVMHVGGIPQ